LAILLKLKKKMNITQKRSPLKSLLTNYDFRHYLKDGRVKKLVWYLLELDKKQNIEINEEIILEIYDNLTHYKTQEISVPRFVYHGSHNLNRESILSKGLIAFENRCTGVFASIPNSFNPMEASHFYPSVCGDTDLSESNLDFWQIDTFQLPPLTWFVDPYTPSDRSLWIFTLNNIPPFALKLYKVKRIGNYLDRFSLYPIEDVNRELKKIKKKKIELYY
jgi:hypothetical protein